MAIMPRLEGQENDPVNRLIAIVGKINDNVNSLTESVRNLTERVIVAEQRNAELKQYVNSKKDEEDRATEAMIYRAKNPGMV